MGDRTERSSIILVKRETEQEAEEEEEEERERKSYQRAGSKSRDKIIATSENCGPES